MVVGRKSEKCCRICFDEENVDDGYGNRSLLNGKLIAPCNCRGVFSFVHEKCIALWLERNLRETCDICRFKYIHTKSEKYVLDWLKEEEEELNDIIAVSLIILLSFYILIVGALVNYNTLGMAYLKLSLFLWSLILFWLCLMIALITIYTIRQTMLYQMWKQTHFRVTVQPNLEHALEEMTPAPYSPFRERKKDRDKERESQASLQSSSSSSGAKQSS